MSEIHRKHGEIIKREKISFENNTNKLIEEYLSKIEEGYNNSELSLAIKSLTFNVQKIYLSIKSNNN
jgi:hypothetical protein